VAGLAIGDVRDRAGVDDVCVGGSGPIDDLDAAPAEVACDLLGVGLVELAAQRDDGDAGDGRRRCCDITSRPVREERQVDGIQDLRRVRVDAVALPAESQAS
jgi:hypothetical protein